MRKAAVAFGLAGLAAAGVGWAHSPNAVADGARAAAARCSPGKHLGAAVGLLPEVTVSGKSKWKYLKPGDTVTTDPYGSANICLAKHQTFCRVGPSSTLRVQPRAGVLLRAGGRLDVTCSQRNTDVGLSHDGAGYYLRADPVRASAAVTPARGQLAREDPSAVTGDPVFSFHVGGKQAVIKVRRGSGIVDTGGNLEHAVVLGRNQQVKVPAAQEPSQPTTIKLTRAEKKVFQQVARTAPKDTDKTPPDVTLSGPRDPSSVRSATLSFDSMESGLTFSCALDGTDFRLCTSAVQIPRLEVGKHDFAVRATDSAGNSRIVHHVWTVDGSRIVFESFRDGNPELYTEDPDGENQVRLTNNLISDEHPDWAPDRKRIVFDRLDQKQNLDIWTTNADGTGETRLTTDRAPDRNPSWSPDGTRIVFERGPMGDRQIYVMNADGTGGTQLTFDPVCDVPCSVDNLDPGWSSDSKRIVFASTRDGNYEIYVMNADGSGQTRLTNDQTNDFGPSWSPDGKRIAFHSNRSGVSYNIYVMNPDGTGVTRVTTSNRNDTNPSWAPDSEHLVFDSDRDPSTELQLYVVDALTRDEPTRIPAPSTRANFAADW